MQVSQLMTEPVVTIGIEDSVAQVRHILLEHKIHALPVLDSLGHVCGIVTSTDVLALAYQAESDRLPVRRVMQRQVATLPGDADAQRLARLMFEKRLHHVIVMDGKHLQGIVSSWDLLKMLDPTKLPPNPAFDQAQANLAELEQELGIKFLDAVPEEQQDLPAFGTEPIVPPEQLHRRPHPHPRRPPPPPRRDASGGGFVRDDEI